FIFDFADITGRGPIDQQPDSVKEQASSLLASFWAVVDFERSAERERFQKRRIITVNTMNSYLERLVMDNLAAIRTRISTRLRHGFVLPSQKKQEQWLPEMQVGIAGVQSLGGIRTKKATQGHVMYGPYKALWPGHHRLRVQIKGNFPSVSANSDAPFVLEVVNREHFFARVPLSWQQLVREEQFIDFEVSDPLATAVEVRMWSTGDAEAEVSSVIIERSEFGERASSN